MFQSVKKYLELIKFSHTVFALPFALMSLLIATGGSPGLNKTLWIILAMVGARSGAMGFNRLVDRKWDAENPRTASRPSVTGEVPPAFNLLMIIISYALLVLAAWKLNPLAFYLSPFAVFFVSFYSYTKRFTFLCHIFLGFAIGIAPIAAWVAVTGEISLVSLFLGFSVMCWIGGFDILYSLQDREFDESADLNSIPVAFGVEKSLWIARVLHICCVLAWVAVVYLANLNLIFKAGVFIATGLLLYEHSLVKKDDLSKIDVAFMNMNAYISVELFLTLALDLYFPI